MNFMAHRSSRTLSELRKMGFDPDKLDKIGSYDTSTELETDPEHLARFENVGADMLNVGKDYQDQVKSVLVYEAYINIDKDGTGEAKRYKVTKAGNQVLDVRRMCRITICTFLSTSSST